MLTDFNFVITKIPLKYLYLKSKKKQKKQYNTIKLN